MVSLKRLLFINHPKKRNAAGYFRLWLKKYHTPWTPVQSWVRSIVRQVETFGQTSERYLKSRAGKFCAVPDRYFRKCGGHEWCKVLTDIYIPW